MENTFETPLLDKVLSPSDLKKIPESDLKQLADEVRHEMIDAVSQTGGHLGAGLGVVELTVALHYVFNTPDDRLIWDVGHQAYPHKILTNRRDRMRTIRQGGGLSGFTKRAESEYDPFGAGHSSTSISAAYGMAVANKKLGKDRHNIAVIGDGAMSAGMVYEAMNNAGSGNSKTIVILNDNDMSIAPPVGAMSSYLSRLISSKSYRSLRDMAKGVAKALPTKLERAAKQAEEYARGMIAGGGTLFEELGFYYVGPIDGHNLDHLLPILRNIRDAKQDEPVLIHVVTEKGRGYKPAEDSSDKYHGVKKFCVATGVQEKKTGGAPSYSSVFGDTLIQDAKKDDKIVAVTAAMPGGTGLAKFGQTFPDRLFDVGIAEQHAVTFAAGMACDGLKPFAAIYSTFLQRAYDQVIHDVALQNLPVRFAIDRAGLVGADGATHAGTFDVAYLGCLPNMVLMAAADEVELQNMTTTASHYDEGPIAFRFPRGEGVGLEMPAKGKILEIGKGRIVKEGDRVAILSYGTRLGEALKAAETLEKMGVSTTVADARFAKPLDAELTTQLARHHDVLVTVEEGSIGGFGSFVMHYLQNEGLLDDGKLKLRSMFLPDRYQDHNDAYKQYEEAGLNASAIVETIHKALGDKKIKLAATA